MVIDLAQEIVKLFAPRAQEDVARATGASPQAAAQFMQSLMDKIAGSPVTTAPQAIAAAASVLEAPPEVRAAKVAELETYSLDYVDKLKPFLELLAVQDQARWKADIAGRESASSVAIAEKKAGVWDMTKTLVLSVVIMLGTISIGLLATIVFQSVCGVGPNCTGTRQVDAVLIGLAGPIWAGTICAGFMAIIMFRFDGTKTSEAQNATIALLPAR